MAKFNLNQILNDASRAAAKGGEPTRRPSESRYEKLSVFDLVPSEDNFYSMREIGELKAAIEIAGKVLQKIFSMVKPHFFFICWDDNKKAEILSSNLRFNNYIGFSPGEGNQVSVLFVFSYG